MNVHMILPLLGEGVGAALVPLPLTLFIDHVIGDQRFGHRRYRLTTTYARLIVAAVAFLAVGSGRLFVLALRAMTKALQGALSLLLSTRRTP